MSIRPPQSPTLLGIPSDIRKLILPSNLPSLSRTCQQLRKEIRQLYLKEVIQVEEIVDYLIALRRPATFRHRLKMMGNIDVRIYEKIVLFKNRSSNHLIPISELPHRLSYIVIGQKYNIIDLATLWRIYQRRQIFPLEYLQIIWRRFWGDYRSCTEGFDLDHLCTQMSRILRVAGGFDAEYRGCYRKLQVISFLLFEIDRDLVYRSLLKAIPFLEKEYRKIVGK